MDNRPIAVIDSGVGGLASLSAIRNAMPNENIIFFGDTAFMPFGTKTEAELNERAEKISKLIVSFDAKMIIVACNTMSCTAMNSLYKAAPMLLIQSMLEPVTKVVSRGCPEGSRLGVIATPRCIESGVYKKTLESLKNKPVVFEKGIPELSVFIENGIIDGPQLESLLQSYMDEMVKRDGIEYLLLGCTHYPLVSNTIKKIYPNLILLDPCEELAKSAKILLKVHELNADDRVGTISLCSSKYTDGFANMAKYLGLSDLEIKEVVL